MNCLYFYNFCVAHILLAVILIVTAQRGILGLMALQEIFKESEKEKL